MKETWNPHCCRNLLTLLTNSANNDFQHPELLFNTLNEERNQLTKLLFTPPRDPSHKKEVEEGRLSLGGLKPNFKALPSSEILALSDELNIDEYLASEIYLNVVYQEVSSKEEQMYTALLQFYKERSYRLDCLELILKYSLDNSGHLYQPQLKEFSQSLTRSYSPNLSILPRKILECLGNNYDLESNIRKFCPSITSYVSNQDSSEINRMRLSEFQTLGRIYFLLYQNKLSSNSDIILLIEILSQANVYNTIFVHLLLSLLVYIVGLTEQSSNHKFVDEAWVTTLKEELFKETWNIRPSQGLAGLFLGPLLHFIADGHRGQDSYLAGLKNAENYVTKSLELGSLQFAINYLFSPRDRQEALTQPIRATGEYISSIDNLAQPYGNLKLGHPDLLKVDVCEEQFYSQMVDCFDFLIRKLPSQFPQLLQSLHKKEEEQLLYHPSDAESTTLPQPNESYSIHTYQRIHHDKKLPFFTTECLYALIALVYNHRSDHGLHFLDEKRSLLNFLKVALTSRAPRLQIAALDMVGALCRQTEYADWVFALFTGTGPTTFPFSWPWFFDHLTKISQDYYANSEVKNVSSLNKFPKTEMIPLKAFLRLFGRVFGNSLKARTSNGPGLGSSILQPLFALMMCPVPTSVKALVLDAISAVAVPIKDPGLSIQLWQAIEEVDIISCSKASKVHHTQSMLNEFMIEKELELYDQTISFLNLISKLIHIPQPKSTQCRSIPHDLGSPHRLPGIIPYIVFIHKNIFTSVLDKSYRNPYQKWEIIALCLGIFDKCLSDFTIYCRSQPLKLREMTTHPGYEIIVRVLQGSSMLDVMLKILDLGLNDMASYPLRLYPCRQNATHKVFLILNKIVRLQDSFITEISPQISNLFCTERQVPTVSSLSYLDQLILYRSKTMTLINIASYVCCNTNHQIAVLSTKLLYSLCSRKSSKNSVLNDINPLLQIVIDSDKASSIIAWYFDKLLFPPLVELESIYRYKSTCDTITLAILDVIIESLDSSTGFSFGHFLLGYREETSNYQSQHQFGPSIDKATSFHAITSLLTSNIEKQVSYYPQGSIESFVLCDTKIISKCYEVLSRLCLNNLTASPTLRFLKSQYSFAAVHLTFLPISPSIECNGDLITSTKKIRTQHHEVINHLNICSWTMKIAACELQNTQDYTSEISNLLSNLFEPESTTLISRNPFYNATRQSSVLKIMNFLDIALAQWEPLLEVVNPRGYDFSVIWNAIDVSTCCSKNDLGEVFYNIDSIEELLNRELPDCDFDIYNSFLGHYRVLNSIPQISMNQRSLVFSWHDLILAATGSIFEKAPKIDHELILLELLICILLKIESSLDSLSRVLDIVSQAIHHIVKVLYKISMNGGSSLANHHVYSFHDKILLVWDSFIQALNRAGGHTMLRNFLYQSIMTFLDYVKSCGVSNLFSGFLTGPQSSALKLSGFGLELLIGHLGADSIGTIPELKLASLRLLAYLDPLLPVPDTHQHAPGSYIISLLPSRCNIKKMIEVLVEEIRSLSSTTGSELFNSIFQSHIEFFIRMAHSFHGVSQLLELNIFDVFDSTNLLSSQLDADVSASGIQLEKDDSFFIVEPLLRLFNAIVINSGDLCFKVGKQASHALLQNPELFSSILRETRRAPSLRSLRLLNHVTSFLYQLTLRCRSFSFKDIGLISYYHHQVLSLISGFSNHKDWLKKISPLYSEEKESNLVPADALTLGTTRFYREAELTVSSILFNVMKYCQIVYCEGTPLVSLNSPLGFYYQISTPPADSSLIRFSSRASLGNINTIILQSCNKVEKQLNDIAKLTKLIGNPGTIPNELVDKICLDKHSELFDDIQIYRRQNRTLVALKSLLESKNNYIQLFIGLIEATTTLLYRQLDLICDEGSSCSPFAVKEMYRNHALEQEKEIFSRQLKTEVHPTLSKVRDLIKRPELTRIFEPTKVDYIDKISQFTQDLAFS